MRKNEENIELLAVLMEACSEIMTDEKVSEILRNGGKKLDAITAALKDHKTACVNLLAALEGFYPDEYTVPPPGVLLMKFVNLMNEPNVQQLFMSQGLNELAASSGSATETIKENEKDGE